MSMCLVVIGHLTSSLNCQSHTCFHLPNFFYFPLRGISLQPWIQEKYIGIKKGNVRIFIVQGQYLEKE